MPSLSKKSMPKLVHHKNKLEACSFNLCRKVFLKISPHFSSQTAITTNTNIKDVRIFLSVFDTPLPHVGNLPNFYLLISCTIGIWDPLPPKIFRSLLWMAPNPKWLCTSHTQIWCSLLNCSWNWSTYLQFCTRVNIKKTILILIFWKMPKQICKNQNISDVNATCINFHLIVRVFFSK